MKKLQSISLKVFLIAMILCAEFVISIIWSGGPDNFGIINQLAFTLFVVGLASFLVWLVTIILDIKDRIEKK
jgi:uncharacterized membrane protein